MRSTTLRRAPKAEPCKGLLHRKRSGQGQISRGKSVRPGVIPAFRGEGPLGSQTLPMLRKRKPSIRFGRRILVTLLGAMPQNSILAICPTGTRVTFRHHKVEARQRPQREFSPTDSGSYKRGSIQAWHESCLARSSDQRTVTPKGFSSWTLDRRAAIPHERFRDSLDTMVGVTYRSAPREFLPIIFKRFPD